MAPSYSKYALIEAGEDKEEVRDAHRNLVKPPRGDWREENVVEISFGKRNFSMDRDQGIRQA